MLEQLYRFRPATFFLPAFFFDAFAFVLPFFLDDEFRLLDLSDLAALFSFAVALRTDDFTLRFFGSALAICGALAPATPPATAPTAAPIGRASNRQPRLRRRHPPYLLLTMIPSHQSSLGRFP